MVDTRSPLGCEEVIPFIEFIDVGTFGNSTSFICSLKRCQSIRSAEQDRFGE
jgi:hypothetical protein